MSRILRHVRQNVVAYLALFVALGGTSYAAISIPRNSVGANQIRNHAIDPVKLNGKLHWRLCAHWAADRRELGNIVASRATRRTILQWNGIERYRVTGGVVAWTRHSHRMFRRSRHGRDFGVRSGPAAVSSACQRSRGASVSS